MGEIHPGARIWPSVSGGKFPGRIFILTRGKTQLPPMGQAGIRAGGTGERNTLLGPQKDLSTCARGWDWP